MIRIFLHCSQMRVTIPARLIVLVFINLIIYGEEHKL
jgi:hypothetical protein